MLLCETLGGAVRTAPGILSHMGAPKEEAGMKTSEWACVSLKEPGGGGGGRMPPSEEE